MRHKIHNGPHLLTPWYLVGPLITGNFQVLFTLKPGTIVHPLHVACISVTSTTCDDPGSDTKKEKKNMTSLSFALPCSLVGFCFVLVACFGLQMACAPSPRCICLGHRLIYLTVCLSKPLTLLHAMKQFKLPSSMKLYLEFRPLHHANSCFHNCSRISEINPS